MRRYKFKNHVIMRSTPPHQSNHKNYKPYLEKDFCSRCAYCNLHKDSITTPFEIDHFIPKDIYKGVREDLHTDYSNLVYSCKKCNGAKGQKFSGDIKAKNVTNERFYDPCTIDYNTVFYRNIYGVISSDDIKGASMIDDIKLYRIIHVIGWVCERLCKTVDNLSEEAARASDPDRKKIIEQTKQKLTEAYMTHERIFKAVYNEKDL